jgi:hypothetical protein
LPGIATVQLPEAASMFLDPICRPASEQLRIRSPPASRHQNLRALFSAVPIRRRPFNDY